MARRARDAAPRAGWHGRARAAQMEFKVMIPDMEADAIKSVKDATRFVSTHPFAEFPGWNRFLPDAGNRVPAS